MTSPIKILLCGAIALAASAETALAGDAAAGEKAFKKCLVCHEIGAVAKNKVGPVLNGLDGRKAGTIPGYSYTAHNKNSGILWGEAVFKEYIKDPQAKIPGTTMVGVKARNEKEAEDLWEYIKQFEADGKKK